MLAQVCNATKTYYWEFYCQFFRGDHWGLVVLISNYTLSVFLRFLIYDVINFWRDVWAFVLLKNIYNLFYCDLFYHKRNYNL